MIKKTILLILMLSFTLNFLSCKKENDVSADLKRIYAVDETGSASEEDIKNKNYISMSPITSINDQVETTKKLNIGGQEYELKYKETLYFSLNGRTVHKYLVNNSETEYVLLREDNSVDAISFPLATLEINNTESPEKVRALFEPLVAEWIDTSKYEYVDIPKQPDGKRFGIYTFTYYNMIDGYVTDISRVTVRDNGQIIGITNRDINQNISPFKIDKDKEKMYIDHKLKELFGTPEDKYISYNEGEWSQVVVYNDELYIQYSVSANCRKIFKGDTYTHFLQRILIPLDMIIVDSK